MRRALLTLLVTVAGLAMLLGFKTQPIESSTTTAASPERTTADDGGDTGDPGDTGGAGNGEPAADPRTVTGDAVDTPYGPVQVEVVMEGDTITEIPVLQAPGGSPNDAEISNYALPILEEEALAAQSADIDTVSGATYTSEGYITSLQSALDEARG